MSEARTLDVVSQPKELEDLMERYQKGDEKAAAGLISKLSGQIFKFYLAEVRERPLAEDLLQDFWLRIHSARRTYRAGEPVLPWIYAIARRVRIDDYRRNRSRRYEVQSERLPKMAAGKSPGDESLNVTDLLAVLPESQRDVILLLKVSGLSLEEAARATGTTVGAVKQKAHRAYERLRKLFGGEA